MAKEMLVTRLMPEAALDALSLQIKTARDTFIPFAKNLDAERRRGARTVATSRIGLASIVEDVAITFPGKFTADDNVAAYSERLANHKKLSQLRDLCASLLENTDDTYLALGVDIMAGADLYIDLLEARRGGDGDLDAAMERIDEYNSKFRSQPNDPTDPIDPI